MGQRECLEISAQLRKLLFQFTGVRTHLRQLGPECSIASLNHVQNLSMGGPLLMKTCGESLHHLYLAFAGVHQGLLVRPPGKHRGDHPGQNGNPDTGISKTGEYRVSSYTGNTHDGAGEQRHIGKNPTSSTRGTTDSSVITHIRRIPSSQG